jgi:hypothetical protein
VDSASAVQIAGGSQLSLTGFDNIDFTGQTITFTGGNPVNILGETGSFTELGTGGTIVFDKQGIAINYNTLTAGSNLACGGGCIFTATNGPNTVTFDLITETVSTGGGFLDISGTGLITLTNFDSTPGTFFLSTQGGSGVNLTFSTTVAVPGPVVGAGIPGLVAACAGLFAFARRRRK